MNVFIQSTLCHSQRCFQFLLRFASSSRPMSVDLQHQQMNTLIRANKWNDALAFFDQQQQQSPILYTLALKACAQLKFLDKGVEIHRRMPSHFITDSYVCSSLINFYMQCGHSKQAVDLYDASLKKTVQMLGAMMKGYISNNEPQKALDIMNEQPIERDVVIFILAFKACALHGEGELGRRLFDEMPVSFRNNFVLMTSALHMFVECNNVQLAEHVFRLMKIKTVKTYGLMMKGLIATDQHLRVLSILEQMTIKDKISVDEVASIMVAKACAQLGMLSKAKEMAQLIPSSFHRDKRLLITLIHMFAKCGDIHEARLIFDSIDQSDNFSFTVMINGYGLIGMGVEALELFYRMPEEMRNEVTYICVINACSHSGLSFEAQQIFNSEPKNRSNPIIVTAMIDCLSRLAMFDEAETLLVDFEKQNRPDPVMHMALLSGARNQQNVALSTRIFERMQRLCPDFKNDLISASVLVANTLASCGLYEEATSVRKKAGPKTKIGLTWTDINGEIVEMHAHDKSHPRTDEIYIEVKRMAKELIEDGHRFDSSWVTTDKKDMNTEDHLCGHSEKLALALNFISTPIPSPIQMAKNLRVCGDCHEATKRIARIRQRNIIVRDTNRFHFFSTDGHCSCKDHF